ncbi:phenylalanine--tRNA ligase, mitochondrial [Aplysia californica]|uniref:phenylalanine--tRNA ligase n=1 Tax=Aplysia californica TaxID=6500 RepID=A0ABM0JEU2_APLCA|nr:phenylalanine--tRNA ligase, mitochondrial [Aplysia californica]
MVLLRQMMHTSRIVLPSSACTTYLRITASLHREAKHHSPANKVCHSFGDSVEILGKSYPTDHFTNATPTIVSKIGRNLHNKEHHPLHLIYKRIESFFHKSYLRRGNPIFSAYSNLSPVVTHEQNFDSLLVPQNHVSRLPSDTYYINSEYMLRAHTSAHQRDLVRSGLDAFIVAGDVYRRDAIDATHYPVFHQMEGVRLFSDFELFNKVSDLSGVSLFEDGRRDNTRQETHSLETSKLVEHDLKVCLEALMRCLFGEDLNMRWVDAYFPFTHPSWELEIYHQEEWVEMLGCGVMEQKLLDSAGATNKVGWAFGLGLERLAMKLFSIPDIRLFWSTDSGFLHQFEGKDFNDSIIYKPVSKYPQCVNDISFWIPEEFSPNDFYDLVRSVGGDLVEQVSLVDEFLHPKKKRMSHCYRIVYRHMEKTLTQEEVNEVHQEIENLSAQNLGVEVR